LATAAKQQKKHERQRSKTPKWVGGDSPKGEAPIFRLTIGGVAKNSPWRHKNESRRRTRDTITDRMRCCFCHNIKAPNIKFQKKSNHSAKIARKRDAKKNNLSPKGELKKKKGNIKNL